MHKYEAMFIVKPDLSEEEKNTLFQQIQDAVIKLNGKVANANIWQEKRKLAYVIKKYQEGTYYLMHFSLKPLLVKDLRYTYKLNENILRVLITKIE